MRGARAEHLSTRLLTRGHLDALLHLGFAQGYCGEGVYYAPDLPAIYNSLNKGN